MTQDNRSTGGLQNQVLGLSQGCKDMEGRFCSCCHKLGRVGSSVQRGSPTGPMGGGPALWAPGQLKDQDFMSTSCSTAKTAWRPLVQGTAPPPGPGLSSLRGQSPVSHEREGLLPGPLATQGTTISRCKTQAPAQQSPTALSLSLVSIHQTFPSLLPAPHILHRAGSVLPAPGRVLGTQQVPNVR